MDWEEGPSDNGEDPAYNITWIGDEREMHLRDPTEMSAVHRSACEAAFEAIEIAIWNGNINEEIKTYRNEQIVKMAEDPLCPGEDILSVKMSDRSWSRKESSSQRTLMNVIDPTKYYDVLRTKQQLWSEDESVSSVLLVCLGESRKWQCDIRRFQWDPDWPSRAEVFQRTKRRDSHGPYFLEGAVLVHHIDFFAEIWKRTEDDSFVLCGKRMHYRPDWPTNASITLSDLFPWFAGKDGLDTSVQFGDDTNFMRGLLNKAMESVVYGRYRDIQEDFTKKRERTQRRIEGMKARRKAAERRRYMQSPAGQEEAFKRRQEEKRRALFAELYY